MLSKQLIEQLQKLKTTQLRFKTREIKLQDVRLRMARRWERQQLILHQTIQRATDCFCIRELSTEDPLIPLHPDKVDCSLENKFNDRTHKGRSLTSMERDPRCSRVKVQGRVWPDSWCKERPYAGWEDTLKKEIVMCFYARGTEYTSIWYGHSPSSKSISRGICSLNQIAELQSWVGDGFKRSSQVTLEEKELPKCPFDWIQRQWSARSSWCGGEIVVKVMWRVSTCWDLAAGKFQLPFLVASTTRATLDSLNWRGALAPR